MHWSLAETAHIAFLLQGMFIQTWEPEVRSLRSLDPKSRCLQLCTLICALLVDSHIIGQAALTKETSVKGQVRPYAQCTAWLSSGFHAMIADVQHASMQLKVISEVTKQDTGKYLSYEGKELPY